MAVAAGALGGAAPVPKSKPVEPPPKMNAKSVEGRWGYEWQTMRDGWIEFDGKDGYSAEHVPGSGYLFFGSYAVDGNAVILTEWVSHNGKEADGPRLYRFEFDLSKWPAPEGKSTGGYDEVNRDKPPRATIHVKLRDRKQP